METQVKRSFVRIRQLHMRRLNEPHRDPKAQSYRTEHIQNHRSLTPEFAKGKQSPEVSAIFSNIQYNQRETQRPPSAYPSAWFQCHRNDSIQIAIRVGVLGVQQYVLLHHRLKTRRGYFHEVPKQQIRMFHWGLLWEPQNVL